MSSEKDGEYLPLPPILVSTTGLENYLENLNRNLARDLKDTKKTVATVETSLRTNTALLVGVKNLLGNQAIDWINEHSDTAGDASDLTLEDDSLTAENELDSNAVLLKVLSASKKLMRDNMDLKKALEASTCRSEELLKLHASISLELEGVRREMNLYRDEVRQLCVWLGLYNTEGKNIVEVPSAEGDPSHNEEVFSTIITTSPILLALRRSLLKDFSDRSVHTSSKQLQEIGNSVAQLKNEISHFATVEKVKSVVNELHSREENNPSGSVDKRLKAIESNYVKREEFTNSMKTKVDNLVLPAKADNAVVSDIDRRINEKLADMEERLLLYEMERKDFRTILKNLVNSNGVGGVGEVNSASPAPPRSVNNRPEGQDSAALQLTPRDPRDDAQGSSHSKQVYKVVGTSRGTFATTSTVSPEEKKVTKHSKKASSPSPKEEVVGKEAVGLTANQAAYAVFVTNENKEKIESLPPLNYEKMKK